MSVPLARQHELSISGMRQDVLEILTTLPLEQTVSSSVVLGLTMVLDAVIDRLERALDDMRREG